MKSEMNPKVVAGIVVVLLLVVIGIGWKVFAPTNATKADSDAFLASHPAMKAASENMSKMAEHPTPPPGINTGGRRAP